MACDTTLRRAHMNRRQVGLAGAVMLAAIRSADVRAQTRTAQDQTRAAASDTPTVVAFDCAGYPHPSGAGWLVPSELWVYRPQDSAVRKGLIAGLMRTRYGLETTADTQALFDRRINLLLADNIGRYVPAAQIAGVAQRYPATRSNGHTRLIARLPADIAGVHSNAHVPITTGAGQDGRAHLVDDQGVSIISDIDDTVKDTGVLDRRRLWESTFFLPFKAVVGMPDLLRALAGDAGAVHYVSSTPWHLYAPLREWLGADNFPVSSLHLKQIRLKDASVLNILKSPEALKPPVISALLQRWPRRRFVLIGDSGEKDPEIYGAITRSYGQQIARILIRRAPGDTSGAERFGEAFAGIPRERWQVFDAPAEVTWRP